MAAGSQVLSGCLISPTVETWHLTNHKAKKNRWPIIIQFSTALEIEGFFIDFQRHI
jgi:hypothetical protein